MLTSPSQKSQACDAADRVIPVRKLVEGQVLDLWERGWAWSPIERALMLLATAMHQPFEAVAGWSIGQRDRALLELREALFGPRLLCVADCPACGERLDLEFSTHDLCTEVVPHISPLVVEADGYVMYCRLPNSMDLMRVTNRAALLARCLIDVQPDGKPQTTDDLPSTVVDAVADALERADPQADTRLALVCPSCEHAWTAPFDIVGFLWSEIDTWARRTLGEVHALAREYGWSESEILALTPRRRRWYIQMVYG